MISTNAAPLQLTKQGHLWALRGCRSSLADVSSTFHVCKEITWFLRCLIFALRIQGMAKRPQQKGRVHSRPCSSNLLPFLPKVAAGCGDVGCVRAHSPELRFSPPDKNCKTQWWQERSTYHRATVLYQGKGLGKGWGSWGLSLWEHLYFSVF